MNRLKHIADDLRKIVAELMAAREVPRARLGDIAQQLDSVGAAIAHHTEAQAPPSVQNRYGVDVRYFDEKLRLTLRDIGNYKPDELARTLARLAAVADAAVLLEREFGSAASTGLVPDAHLRHIECPGCGKSLSAVTQSADSIISAELFAANRLGDWFCTSCPPDSGAKYRYFWDNHFNNQGI